MKLTKPLTVTIPAGATVSAKCGVKEIAPANGWRRYKRGAVRITVRIPAEK